MTRYCLDSWAVLRWLQGVQPAASRVRDVMEADPDQRPVMSWMNVGEVYDVMRRNSDAKTAAEIVVDLRRTLDLDDASANRVLEAAAIKADHPMAFADAFAVATAEAHDAVLLTGDPEILDRDGGWRVEDLRP